VATVTIYDGGQGRPKHVEHTCSC